MFASGSLYRAEVSMLTDKLSLVLGTIVTPTEIQLNSSCSLLCAVLLFNASLQRGPGVDNCETRSVAGLLLRILNSHSMGI